MKMRVFRFRIGLIRFRPLSSICKKAVLSALFIFMVSCGHSGEEKLLAQLGLEWKSYFAYPEIVGITPPDNTYNVPKDSSIVIDFNKPMDKIFTEAAISVSASGGNTAFSPSWVFDTRLILEFKGGLTEGKRYEISINKNQVKDQDHNLMAKNVLSHFYTEGLGQIPSVVSSVPASTGSIVTGWGVSSSPIINFSEPMDEAVTNGAISISGGPAVYLAVWNANRTSVTLQLKADLDIGTTYTLKVASSAKSQSGIPLAKDYMVSFSTGNAAQRPTVLPSMSLTAWPTAFLPDPAVNPAVPGNSKNDFFVFTFSEAMDKQSVMNAITFVPGISGQFEWVSGSLVYFRPSSPLQSEATYRMKISNTAKSMQGQNLLSGYIIDFLVDNAGDSRAIAFAGVNGRTFDVSCTISAAVDLAIGASPDLNLVYPISPNTACTQQYEFELSLNTSGGQALKTFGDGDIFSSGNISIDYVSGGPTTSSLRIDQIDYLPSANPQRVKVRIRGVSNNQVRYKFTLRGGSSGIRDINENILKNDLEFLFYDP
ncbi:Ig-like domain-containing protein [Leptospira yasudae]|uniref:Ig-like domain-containing protein n=1 Tax=Leptospira yasudae TaxID=2202201 RepID=UPI001FF02F1C|nr:Ig-like domain-containing protein [Leptospira yasudae]